MNPSSPVAVQWRTERRHWARPLRWLAVFATLPLIALSLFGRRHGDTPWDGFALLFLPAAAIATSLLKRGFATSAVLRGANDYAPTLLIGSAQRVGHPKLVVGEYSRPDGHVYLLPGGERIVATGARGMFPTFGLSDGGVPRPLGSVSVVWVLARYVLTLVGAFVATVFASLVTHASDTWMVAFLTTFSCLFFLGVTRRTTLEIGRDGVRLRGTFSREFSAWGNVSVDRVRRKLTLNGRSVSFVSFQYDLAEVDAALAKIEEAVVDGERFALHGLRLQAAESIAAFRVRVAESSTNYRIAAGPNEDEQLLHGLGVPNDLRIGAALRIRAQGGEAPVRVAATAVLDRRLATVLREIADGTVSDETLNAALRQTPENTRGRA